MSRTKTWSDYPKGTYTYKDPDYHKNRRAKAKAEGRCIQCGKPHNHFKRSGVRYAKCSACFGRALDVINEKNRLKTP